MHMQCVHTYIVQMYSSTEVQKYREIVLHNTLVFWLTRASPSEHSRTTLKQ